MLTRERRDHEEFDRFLIRLRSSARAEQDEVLACIDRLVFPHAFAEEAVLWPAGRAALPDREAVTVRIEREHQEINEPQIASDPAFGLLRLLPLSARRRLVRGPAGAQIVRWAVHGTNWLRGDRDARLTAVAVCR